MIETQKLRITFVLPYAGMSGGNRVLATYANRLHRRGHRVFVVSIPQERLGLLRRCKLLFQTRRWPKDPGPQHSYFDSIDVTHRVLESARPAVNEDVPDADIILATFWRTGPWVAAMSPRKGAKAILLQGYETSPGDEDPAIDEVWRLPLQKIVISKWLLELARNRFGDINAYHVPNSVDTEQFYAVPRTKQSIPTVGMLYATPHFKGADICLTALRLVRQQIPNIRVLAFGAERVSSHLPLPDWIEFQYRPPQHAIRALYSSCDAWLCGSRREGFHLPPLEAMACRCPVVSTRVGGPMDLVEDSVNGFLVDVEDSVALAERLIDLLNRDKSSWMLMSEAALAAATRYTWDDATARLESALLDIVAKAARTRQLQEPSKSPG